MSSKFLLVVLGMGADPFHNHPTTTIANLDYQPIPVALDVEYDSVVGQKIGAAVALLNVLRCLPLAALDFVLPGIQRSTGTAWDCLNRCRSGKPRIRMGGLSEYRSFYIPLLGISNSSQ